nr:MAG TPA: hypothetical protein [Caudoviricetes sp.]
MDTCSLLQVNGTLPKKPKTPRKAITAPNLRQ